MTDWHNDWLNVWLKVGSLGFLYLLNTPSTWGICANSLQTKIEDTLRSNSLKSARVGVYATKLNQTFSPIINIDGDKYFTPASNIKLFTTAVALELLGANYQIPTSLWIDRSRKNLWVKGGGDPSFNEQSLKTLVGLFKASGIAVIGENILVTSELKGTGIGAGWQWQDLQEDYGAIASPLIVNENVLDWTITSTQINQPAQFSWDRPDFAQGWIVDNQVITVGAGEEGDLKVERSQNQLQQLKITGKIPLNSPPELGATAIPNPEPHFLQLLRREMVRQGFSFSAQLSNQSPEISRIKFEIKSAIKVAEVLSPAIAELVKVTNKQSNNIYAEALLRRIGTLESQNLAKTEVDSEITGLELVGKFLASKGISEVQIRDGSGLSGLNLATPRAIAQLLVVMANNKIFRNSLAIAGIDGTLKNRLKSTIAANNLQAKTGTLTGTRALSGYMQPPKYPELAFSIVINNAVLSSAELQKNIDAVVLMLMDIEECS